MSTSKIRQILCIFLVFASLSSPSHAQKFEEIPIAEFEGYIRNLGTEVVKQFELSKKVALTSGKKSRGDFWAVSGIAMGSVNIFQAGKIGTLSVTLIIKETGKRFKSKFKLKRKSQWKKWEFVK